MGTGCGQSNNGTILPIIVFRRGYKLSTTDLQSETGRHISSKFLLDLEQMQFS